MQELGNALWWCIHKLKHPECIDLLLEKIHKLQICDTILGHFQTFVSHDYGTNKCGGLFK